jgi:excinuclease UvrABC helicase subunit UvrB
VADFQVLSPLTPQGDQPRAIEQLVAGFREGKEKQVLLGVTGSGKTFTMAKVVEALNRPTLVLSHNKTLAAQLYQEFRSFFPKNRVEYFVSYYDYYQPEAYVPQSDTYIEKETDINEEIDKLRIAATAALFERRDVLIVASVSCIYGLGSPESFGKMAIEIEKGARYGMTWYLKRLVEAQYERTNMDLPRAWGRARRRAVLRGAGAEGRVLRRRDRADHTLRDRDGPERGGDRPLRALPEVALRHPGGGPQARARVHRGRARRAARGAEGAEQAARSPAP